MSTHQHSKFFIVGGAGFIGSHFTDFLLNDKNIRAVTLFDNLSSGHKWHVSQHFDDVRFRLVTADVKNFQALQTAMADHDAVIHLASNPDIARAAKEPSIDFHEGTFLTQNVLEAMRVNGVPSLIYASGSGVYGDLGQEKISEDHGPLIPISTYGASKLAGEALIASYGHMFGIRGWAFRFANVVGSRQTHGVGFDFVRRLLADPKQLHILGDGTQSKSYIHVSDICHAVMTAFRESQKTFQVFNVGTDDAITVKEIADLALHCLKIDPANTQYIFSGGDRGWKGDVPIVRLDTRRIRALGWNCRLTSRSALESAFHALIKQHRSQESEDVP